MALQTKTTLKSYFETGDTPTEAQFDDLITTMQSRWIGAPTTITYGATIQPNMQDGDFRKVALTGNIELDPPTNPTEGMRLELWITVDGTNRTLTIDSAILIPTDSGFTSPKTLTASKTYIVMLRYLGSAWGLVSVVGGY
jgi:hypothetical protein